jgi:hypothetical protein
MRKRPTAYRAHAVAAASLRRVDSGKVESLRNAAGLRNHAPGTRHDSKERAGISRDD